MPCLYLLVPAWPDISGLVRVRIYSTMDRHYATATDRIVQIEAHQIKGRVFITIEPGLK
ncbi:MAG: hypothetical protein HW384_2169 [Dehalococcoidia bacterium]|nr:hypothetical protein [Dehalococcoidia bacterium]